MATQNPPGSSDPRDLVVNAGNLDVLVTSKEKLSQNDRLGVPRKTWHAMEVEHDQAQGARADAFDADQADRTERFVQMEGAFSGAQSARASEFSATQLAYRQAIRDTGLQVLGDYAAGIEFTDYNQAVRLDGEFWKPAAATALPYTTTGAGMPEGEAFVAVGDAVLRQELADPAQGAAVLARGVVAVDSIADLLALPAGQRRADLRYFVASYHGGWAAEQPYRSPQGGGEFYFYPADDIPANGVTIFAPDEGGRFIRIVRNGISPEMAGALPGVDSSAAWEAACALGGRIVTEHRSYVIDSPVSVPVAVYLDLGKTEFDIKESVNGFNISANGCTLQGGTFKKRGDLAETLSVSLTLVNVTGDNFNCRDSVFIGQHRGISFSGNGASVSDCTFSYGVFMLYLAGCSNVSVTGCHFSLGRDAFTPADLAERQGDGIKITQGPCSNITITGNTFDHCYRDAIDVYSGGRNITISGNTIINPGLKAFDVKVNAQHSMDSPDGPLCRDVVISDNTIFDDLDRTGFSGDEGIVNISMRHSDPGQIDMPTTKEDVKSLGMRNVLLSNNIIQTGYPTYITLGRSYGIRIIGNTLVPTSDNLKRVVWAPYSWGLEFRNNTVNPKSEFSRSNLNQGNEALIIGNTLNNVSVLIEAGLSGWVVSDNIMTVRGTIHVGGIGSVVCNNTIKNTQDSSIRVLRTAVNCGVMRNTIIDSATAIYVDFSEDVSNNVVKDNLSINSGGFSNLNRVVESGGHQEGNISV